LSKKFTLTPFTQKGEIGSAFQITWPQFESKTYTSSVPQLLKGLEEKALKQVREKAFLIEKEAYELGFAQGERDGLEFGQKRLETIIQPLKNLLAEVERQRRDLYKAHEREMVQLALSISNKVLHQELEGREKVITATLREAFQQVVDQRKVIFHLHPMDYQHLLDHPEEVPCILRDLETVRLIKDPAITRGGCLLETPFGEIDATLEAQFDQIVSRVWEHLEESGSTSGEGS
jgi:flagellar assembly protein FliH